MEQSKVIEGNMLIAEFMGQRGNWLLGSPRDFKYHVSWDWLMPVVEKIARIYENLEEKPSKKWRDEIVYALCMRVSIDSAWIAVVEFIDCYSQDKTFKK